MSQELRPIARKLACEKRLGVASGVRTCLEVNDPANTVRINERTVNDHVLQAAAGDAGERKFACGIPMRR